VSVPSPEMARRTSQFMRIFAGVFVCITMLASLCGLSGIPVARAATAVDDVAITDEDTPILIDVLHNDVSTDTLSIGSVSDPSHGTATVTAGKITYTPDANWNGTDTFTYAVDEGNSMYSAATGHYYKFLDVPTGLTWAAAKSDATAQPLLYGLQGYLVTITSQAEQDFVTTKLHGQGWLGASDADVEGEWRWVTGPENGTQFWAGNGTTGHVITYANWNGGEPNNSGNEDCGQFLANGLWNDLPSTYAAIYGYVVEYGNAYVAPATATVTVNVNPVNDAPVISAGSTLTIFEDSGAAKKNVIVPSDPDSRIFTYSIVQAPSKGTASFPDPHVNTYKYIPSLNANGSDAFTWKVNDGSLDSNTLTQLVQITPVNDVPSYTKGPDQTVPEDCGLQTVSAWATSISAGPSDEAGQALNFIVTNNNNTLFSAQPAIAANGTLTWAPVLNQNGSATVTVRIHDNGGTANGGVDTSAPQTFSITVTPVNDPPVNTVAPSISGAMNVGGTLTAAPGTWNDAIDTAVSGTSTLTCTYQWQRADDAFGANAANITSATAATYVLVGADVHKYLRVGVTCTDSGVGLPATQSVLFSTSWTSQVINRIPVITEGTSTSVTMDEDGSPTAWSLTLNATDADGDTLTWSILTLATHGTATASGTGTSKAIGYTPTANYNGSDSFVVQVSDGYGGTDDIAVNITVNPRNDPPVNTVAPNISGIPHTGRTLTSTTGEWNDSIDLAPGNLTYAFQWQRSTDGGATFLDVSDATGSTYPLTLADNLHLVRSEVTCTDDGEGLPASLSTSALSAQVSIAVLNAVPVVTAGAAASVTMDEDGSPTPWNLTLHATDADVIDTLTWSIITAPAHGTLALPANPTGLSVTPVYHPALNWNGTDTFLLRVDDGLTGTADITVTVTVNPINDAPVCMGLPSVSGTGVAGHQLTADAGSWDDHQDQAPGHVGISVQWLRATTASGLGAQPVAGVSGMTYDVRAGDVGFFLGVQVTAMDDGEGLPASMQTSAISNFIRAVAVAKKDTTPPVVQFVHPWPIQVTASRLSIDVTAADIRSGVRSLMVNGTQVYPYTNGIFHCDLLLVKGDNAFAIIAVDNAGNQWSQTYHVLYAPPAPHAFTHTITLVIGSKAMIVDGAKATLDAPAIIREGRTLIPLRALVESLGGTISWNAKTQQVVVKARGATIVMSIGKNTATVNGKSLRIDPKNAKVVPVLSSGHTLLPLRFVAEQLGFEVGWNETTRTVTLTCED
jgi:hypothetical protein